MTKATKTPKTPTATAGQVVPTDDEPRTVCATQVVTEFIDWTTELSDAAVIVDDLAAAAAPALTFDEATRALDTCRTSRGLVTGVETTLSSRLADLWDEGQRAVTKVKVKDVGDVVVTRRSGRTKWDHEALLDEYISRRLSETDGKVPDPLTVARWVIEAAHPSYWRMGVLAELGIDIADYCETTSNEPEVEITKPKRRATPARRDKGDRA